MAEIIVEEIEIHRFRLTCPVCGRKSHIETDDAGMLKTVKKVFGRQHRKCKEGTTP